MAFSTKIKGHHHLQGNVQVYNGSLQEYALEVQTSEGSKESTKRILGGIGKASQARSAARAALEDAAKQCFPQVDSKDYGHIYQDPSVGLGFNGGILPPKK